MSLSSQTETVVTPESPQTSARSLLLPSSAVEQQGEKPPSEVHQRRHAKSSPASAGHEVDAESAPAPRILVPRTIALLATLHLLAALFLRNEMHHCDWRTFLNSWVWGLGSGLGVTAGAHRLWTHRTYHAGTPLRILLMLLFTVSGQNDLHDWVRDHRLHHRHSETDADPHNAHRGFFFAHCGWLMVRKHPEVSRRGASIDMTDVLADPVVAFQRRWFIPLSLAFSLVIPSLIPCLCWDARWQTAVLGSILRLVISLHCTWLVNSAAHIWGMHPYDAGINPTENLVVAIAAMGEGWHNYHHVFPWDYRAAELPGWTANLTTGFIDICAHFGWVWGRKTASRELIRRQAQRGGDGSWRPQPSGSLTRYTRLPTKQDCIGGLKQTEAAVKLFGFRILSK